MSLPKNPPIRVALYEPEIPGNTGNIIRLCANVGAELHLIEPLGFDLDDAKLRRAGLDYHEWADVRRHPSYDAFRAAVPGPLIGFSTHASASLFEHRATLGQTLLFGPETRGLPLAIRRELAPDNLVRLPMRSWSRSLNLSNAVAIGVYETWRQLGFDTGT